MIFVNYGSGGYAEFEHGPWHGITFADIVFPFFVWMLGTSMVISLKNASDRNVSKRSTLAKAAIRTVKLFVRSISCEIDRTTEIILSLDLDHWFHSEYAL
jgi:heparan-alpha-glucosaminide N-acetyltransferase